MNIAFLLILLGVFLNASAQILLKAGVNRIGHFAFSWHNLIPIGWKMATNVPIIMGISAYVISVIVWLMVLSRVPVNYAYPMVSMGYILTAIAAYYFLGETLSITRILGIVIIIAGVFLVARG